MDNVGRLTAKPFLEDALKHYFKATAVNIVKLAVSKMMLPGENYGSDLLRISIMCSINNRSDIQKLSIVAKCFPTDEIMKAAVTVSNVFEQEIRIYDELMPILYNLGNREKLCPDPIYLSLEPEPILLLEDLDKLNFRNHEREGGLDLEHCRLVVEKLAYFHASSVAVYEKNQDLIKKYNKGFYFGHRILDDYILVSYNSFIDACERCPDLQHYVPKLKSLKDSILSKLYELNKVDSKVINVLNHGDFEIGNLMFLYAHDGKLSDVVFVDFQYPFYSSPATDLHSFWTSSVTREVREKYTENIFRHYFEQLLMNLSKWCVKVNPPTYQQFYDDFRSRAIYGFASLFLRLHFVKVPKTDSDSMDNFLDNNSSEHSFRYRCYNNKSYLEELEYFLPLYDSFGVFD